MSRCCLVKFACGCVSSHLVCVVSSRVSSNVRVCVPHSVCVFVSSSLYVCVSHQICVSRQVSHDVCVCVFRRV